jgi:hypothetical protein
MTTHAILERAFDSPLSADDVWGLAHEGAWCFDLHKVDWHGSFLGVDGRTLICWFSAADLESTRLALRETGADSRRFWPGSVHEGPKRATPNVVVERSFAAPVRLADIQAIEDAAAWCLEAHNVTFVRTFFSLDGMRMLCFYEAPDAESVRLAQAKAAMPVDAVRAVARVGPAPIPRSPA